MIATLSEACAQWHRMHGRFAICDLDCGSGEIVHERFMDDYEALIASDRNGIRCGSCKGRHAFASTVKFCYEVAEDAKTFERNEAAMIAELEASDECEHGLSAALCSGPMHY